MPSLTIHITPLEKEVLKEVVASGEYPSITNAVRAAIRVYFKVWERFEKHKTVREESKTL